MDKKQKTEIKEALGLLDVNNPDHWTTDGLPRLDVLSDITKKEVKRKMVTEVAPLFTLENPVLSDDDSWLDEKDEDEKGEGDAEGATPPVIAAKAPVVPDSQKKAAPAPAAPASGYSKEDCAALEKDIAFLTEKIDRNKSRIDDLTKEIADSEAALARKIDEKNKAMPPMTEAQAFRSYLDRQHAERAGRAEAANRLRQLAGTSVIQGKSPIDAAMSRKTGRGVTRPHMALPAGGQTGQ